MNRDERFNDILNDCLDLIIKGETVESCLKKYADQAKELEPLLRAARSVKVVSSIKPDPEFKARARAEFQASLKNLQARKSKRSNWFSWQWHRQSAWSIAAASLALILIAGGSVVFAARQSMPGETLYAVKISSENIQLAMTPSEVGKAELNARFAERRVDEIIEMTSQGEPQEVLAAANNLSSNFTNMSKLAGGGLPNAINEGSGSVPDTRAFSADSRQSPALMSGSENQTGTFKSAKVPQPVSAPIIPPENSDKGTFGGIVEYDNATQSASGDSYCTVESSGENNPNENLDEDLKTGSASEVEDPEKTELEQVMEIIVNSYFNRQNRLQEALVNANSEMQPLIQEVMDRDTREFEQALANNNLALNSR